MQGTWIDRADPNGKVRLLSEYDNSEITIVACKRKSKSFEWNSKNRGLHSFYLIQKHRQGVFMARMLENHIRQIESVSLFGQNKSPN